MLNEVIFDIETKKIFDDIDGRDPADLGVSIVSVYCRQLDDNFREINGEMSSFWESDLPKMWPLFTNADRIIGYNSLNFDVPALYPLCPYNFKKLSHFDILDKIKQILGFRISLDAVAKETVGHTKTDVGINAVLNWLKGTPESLQKLKDYCEADVLVTRDVYDYGLHHRELKFKDKWNTLRIIPVDFSYPKSDRNDQISLF